MRLSRWLLATIVLASAAAIHERAPHNDVRNSDSEHSHHMLKVAGMTLDTRSMPGLLDQPWTRRLWSGNEPRQWYAVFAGNSSNRIARETGVNLSLESHFIPNSACIFVATQSDAHKVASHSEVQWVGERLEMHKVSSHLASALRQLQNLRSEDRDAADWVLWSEELHRDLEEHDVSNAEVLQRRTAIHKTHDTFRHRHHSLQQQLMSRQTLMVTLLCTEPCSPAPTAHDTTHQHEQDALMESVITAWTHELSLLVETAPVRARARLQQHTRASTWARWAAELLWTSDAPVPALHSRRLQPRQHVRIYNGGSRRLVVHVAHHSDVDALVLWLSRQTQVLHVEHRRQQFPHAAAGKKILFEGAGQKALNCLNKPDQSFARTRQLDGRGEIIGISDTGIDWDNCYVWESANSATFLERGQKPPLNVVDMTRRKIVGYDFLSDCNVCAMCPHQVGPDRKELRAPGALLMAKTNSIFSFPQDASASSLPNRDYDSGGASMSFEITAVTAGFPSEFVAPGAGAFDFPSKISLAVLRRQDLALYLNSGNQALCLNDCTLEGNTLTQLEPLDLPASSGGFSVVIHNRGALGVSADIGAHVQLRGYVQMLTARKPCGDEGDDDDGHGTHVVGVATGAADAPLSMNDKKQSAALNDGMAPGAQLLFHDIMQNGDVACKLAGDDGGICDRVQRVTPPIDLQRNLFAKAHAVGARVHLNAWGCKVPSGETGDYCNDYTSDAADMDTFMYLNPESLVVTAVGDAGEQASASTVASPATNKNGISVGSSDTWNEAYVAGALEHDPMLDICDCTFPNECSKSERILGVFVDDNTPGASRTELMARLEPCCNDAISIEHVLTDQVIPSKQMWSYVVPDKSMFDPEIQNYIKDTFRWAQEGASIEYDYSAKSEVFATPSYTVSEALIQVMIFARQDFYEYFEAGNPWCGVAQVAAGIQCRPNPCVSDASKQQDGSEQCLSRPALISDPIYSKQSCTPQNFGGMVFQDVHCHDAECFDDPKPGDKVWGALPKHGCDMTREEPQCCSDAFLNNFCLNAPCNNLATRQSGAAKHLSYPIPNTLKKASSGYAVVIRNMALQPIRVSGRLRIRKPEFPCTLESCCFAEPTAGCCPRNYTRLYGKTPACGQCSRDASDPNCRPYEASEIPSWSARGPAIVQPTSVDKTVVTHATGSTGWLKPDLVAPGAAVAANSDGNTNSAGDGEDYGVQCGLGANVTTSIFGCDVLKSLPYNEKTASIQKTGSSVSAALVAGAAVIIRQYLADGFYPSGQRSDSRSNIKVGYNAATSAAGSSAAEINPYARPPAALIKALLIQGASSVGGRTNANTYFPDPACNQEEQTNPCPLVFSTARVQLPPTPNMIEGFGRTQLDSVLWFADSQWSLWLRTNEHTTPGFMHTYTFRLLESTQRPFKVTLCYTDAPSTPGASHVLVNDLDLVILRTSVSMVLNTSIGRKVPTQSFNTDFGNGGSQKDGSNTCEQFAMPTHDVMTVTVIVVAYRLISSSQPYSLVATGLLRPKYHTWITASNGAVRSFVLGLVDNGYDAGWFLFDTFKRGKTKGLQLTDLGIKFPDVSEDMLLEMLTEADDDVNRQLDFMEFVAIVDELSTGALRSAEPLYTEEQAPAEFLQKVAANQMQTTTSSARLLTPFSCVATLFGVCTMMRVIATRC